MRRFFSLGSSGLWGLVLTACSSPAALSESLPPSWVGANAHELWARSDSEIRDTLDVMARHNLRILRVVIRECFDPPVGDIEKPVGTFHDAALDRIDAVLAEARVRGIRVIVSFHDGRNRADGYSKAWPGESFYTETNARAAFRRRIKHVLDHRGAHTGRAWNDLGPVLFAWEIQNRPDWRAAMAWTEDMASYVKILSPEARVSAGGVDFVTFGPLFDELLAITPSVDLWGYHPDPKEPLDQATDLIARRVAAHKRQWLLLEVGGTRSDLDRLRRLYEQSIAVAAKHGVPWLVSSLGRDRHEGCTDLWPGDLIFDSIIRPAASAR